MLGCVFGGSAVESVCVLGAESCGCFGWDGAVVDVSGSGVWVALGDGWDVECQVFAAAVWEVRDSVSDGCGPWCEVRDLVVAVVWFVAVRGGD